MRSPRDYKAPYIRSTLGDEQSDQHVSYRSAEFIAVTTLLGQQQIVAGQDPGAGIGFVQWYGLLPATCSLYKYAIRFCKAELSAYFGAGPKPR
jgi:hypothetical protein